MGPASEYSGISLERRSWWKRDHAWSWFRVSGVSWRCWRSHRSHAVSSLRQRFCGRSKVEDSPWFSCHLPFFSEEMLLHLPPQLNLTLNLRSPEEEPKKLGFRESVGRNDGKECVSVCDSEEEEKWSRSRFKNPNLDSLSLSLESHCFASAYKYVN